MGKVVKTGPKRPNPDGRRVQRDRLAGRLVWVSSPLVFNPVTRQWMKMKRGMGKTYRRGS